MFKPRKLVGWIRGRRGYVRVGGDCLKYLTMEWNRKEGRETNILEEGGKLDQGMGATKRGGLEPTYKLCHVMFHISLCFFVLTSIL